MIRSWHHLRLRRCRDDARQSLHVTSLSSWNWKVGRMTRTKTMPASVPPGTWSDGTAILLSIHQHQQQKNEEGEESLLSLFSSSHSLSIIRKRIRSKGMSSSILAFWHRANRRSSNITEDKNINFIVVFLYLLRINCKPLPPNNKTNNTMMLCLFIRSTSSSSTQQQLWQRQRRHKSSLSSTSMMMTSRGRNDII